MTSRNTPQLPSSPTAVSHPEPGPSQLTPQPTLAKTLAQAIVTGDLAALQALVRQGADLNAWVRFPNETVFREVLEEVCGWGCEEQSHRGHSSEVLACIQWACQQGASLYPNPPTVERFFDEGTPGALWSVIYPFDTEVMVDLLMGGYDPNWSIKHCAAAGMDHFSPPLNEAITQYEETHYGINQYPPEPLARGRVNDSTDLAWIEFLDWIAIKQGHRRPDHLFLLYYFGARSVDEYMSLIAAQPDWIPDPPLICLAKALAHSLARQDLPGARALIHAGADLNHVFHAPEHSTNPLTPVSLALLLAVQKDEAQLRVSDHGAWLREVFTLGVSPNAPSICSGGLGLFEAAVRHVQPQVLACLLELGCDPNAPSGPQGESVFDVAAQTCKQSLWLGGRQAEVQLPTGTVAQVLEFFRREMDGRMESPPRVLTLLAERGAKLGSQL